MNGKHDLEADKHQPNPVGHRRWLDKLAEAAFLDTLSSPEGSPFIDLVCLFFFWPLYSAAARHHSYAVCPLPFFFFSGCGCCCGGNVCASGHSNPSLLLELLSFDVERSLGATARCSCYLTRCRLSASFCRLSCGELGSSF